MNSTPGSSGSLLVGGQRKRSRESLEENARSILYPQWLSPNEVVYLISKTSICFKVALKDAGLLYCTNNRVVWCKCHAFQIPQSYPNLPFSTLSRIEATSAPTTNNPALCLTLKTMVLPGGHQGTAVENYTFEFLSDTALDERNSFFVVINSCMRQHQQGGDSASRLCFTCGLDRELACRCPALTSSLLSSSISQSPSSSSSSSSSSSTSSSSVLLSGSYTLPIPSKVSATKMEEVRRRATLLASDAELRELHRVLVEERPHLLSEEEFWRSRHSAELEAETSVSCQERGAPTEPLSNLCVETGEGTRPLTIKLTPTVIFNIFKEYPAVRKLYETQVPGQVSEKQFWERFLRSEYFHESSHYIDSTYAEGIEDGPQTDRAQKVTECLPLFLNETSPGQGTVVDPTMRPVNLRISHSVIKKINRHGDVVLKTPATALLKHLPSMRAAPDTLLQPPPRPSPTRLDLAVADRDHFFAAHASEGAQDNPLASGRDLACAETRFHLVREWKKQVFDWKTQVAEKKEKKSAPPPTATGATGAASEGDEADARIPPGTDRAFIRELIDEAQDDLQQALKSMGQGAQARGFKRTANFDDKPDTVRALQAHHARSQELLRHFWSAWGAYPLRSAGALAKARRLYEPLRELVRELRRQKDALRADRSAKGFDELLDPMIESLCHAVLLIEKEGGASV